MGPALKSLLQDLAEKSERTPEQTRLFEELALIAAASRPDDADSQFSALRGAIRSHLNVDSLAQFTRPDPSLRVTRPDPAAKVCPRCGQRIP